jgi:trimethylamine--corrinoid protein Co-methyltransferase
MGGDWTVFSPMQGAPFVRDLEGVRRWSTAEDLDNLARLTQSLGAYQLGSGFICEPMDVPVHHRHLNINYAHIVYTDLPHFGLTTSRDKAEDSIHMARIVHGNDVMRNNAVVFGHCSGNSPLVWDQTMLEGLRAFATAGQGVLLSPFVLGAANTPADIAATVAQLNAETLAAIGYAQIVHPGARTIYGQFTVSVSMRTGAPMAGTPEATLINAVVGQLARHYRLPWRTTGAQASAKTFDAQSGYESATSMMGGVTAGANLMLHTGGWDESGLTNCYGKFVLDAEQNILISRYAQGVSFDRFDEALEAVRRVGPGGHYLDDPFTLEHFQDAFSMPELMDFSGYEQWVAAGGSDTAGRGREKAKRLLEDYEPPAIDDAVLAELDDFVARRRDEIEGDVR